MNEKPIFRNHYEYPNPSLAVMKFISPFSKLIIWIFKVSCTLKTIVVPARIIYDRVWKSKNYFEIPAFLPIEREISRVGKFKVMLHFAATEMPLFVFSFEFPALEVPHSKFKKATISK